MVDRQTEGQTDRRKFGLLWYTLYHTLLETSAMTKIVVCYQPYAALLGLNLVLLLQAKDVIMFVEMLLPVITLVSTNA